MHKISCQHVSPRLAEIYEQQQDSVAQDQAGRPRDSWWNSMLERLQLEAETKGSLAEAHDALVGRAQQLAEELRVRGVQVADLDTQLQDRDTQLQDRDTQLQGKDAELTDLEAQLADREAQLKEFYRRVADRDKRIEDADASSAQQATRLAEISAEVAALQRSLRELDSARGDLAKIVESGGRIVSPDFSVDANSTLQDLSDSIRAISETLAERDRWIVALLGELASRRLSLRARKLAPHEQDFVDLHGPDAGQSDE
jgi:DNA repair exonuclease SbcCD ATPase subunit